MISDSLKRLFTPDPVKHYIHDAYVKIVAQARRPFFYSDWKVADSVDGRFDMIVLHLFLIVSRCEQEKDDMEAQEFARGLSEVFFADMDRSLREMGAGDTGVGIRVKNMAQAFYGRLKAYEHTIGNKDELLDALRRNVWREQPVDGQAVESLASYLQRNYLSLKAQSAQALMQGRIVFLS